MPTSAAPNTGYVDDQRIENWDSPLLYQHASAAMPVNEVTPVFNVSRYAYLGGYDGILVGSAWLGITWTADQAGSILVGQRVISCFTASSAAAQWRIPNLGPYVTLGWHQLGATQCFHQVAIFGTNRFHPLEFIPQSAVLVQTGQISVGFGGTNYFYPSDYYAGPIKVVLSTPAAKSWLWGLHALDSTGVWQVIDQDFTAPAATTRLSFIAPSGAWRFAALNNTGGADTSGATIIGSLTGST